MRTRTVALLGVLLGIVLTLATLKARDTGREIFFRLDRIEQYLSQQEMLRQLQQHTQPQSAPEQSHKGELSQPQQWKV
jgi:hypothetical protein